MQYSITSSDPANIASIAPSTGVVSLSVDALELSGNYSVSLRCETLGGEFATALLEIERVEENEFPPRFEEGDRVVNISEARDIEENSFVAQFSATDQDLGTFGSVSYSLHGSQSSGFAINSETGRISLTASLDYDTNRVHLFQVRASNPATDSGEVRFAAVSLTVNVGDVNDEQPLFDQESYSAVVQETTSSTPRPDPGFLEVTCTDVDSDDSNITYQLSDSGPFEIDMVTGSLSLTADLDYETTTSYSFSVSCWDNGNPNLTSSAEIDIVVGSVNEGHPTLRSPGVSAVSEGSPAGTVIARYTAEDPDDGPDGIITFTFSTTLAPLLNINLTTGVLYVSEPGGLDFELLDLESESSVVFSYFFQITACDTHPPSSDCSEKNDVVFIFGVNEDPPEFSASGYSVSYSENTPAGTTITTASCTDPDRGTGRFCSIDFDENVASDIKTTFRVDDETGEIISRVPLDYETESGYSFELVCSDTGSNGVCGGSGVKTDRVRVDVAVEPVNDNKPFFTATSFRFNVSRTTPDDRRTVGVATATDADIDEGGELEYTLQSNGYFAITDEGNIQIFNSVFNYSLDFFSLDVTVSDGDNNDSALVIIDLTDGNLNMPEFVSGPAVIQVSELSPKGTSIISLLCEDSDTGINGEVRYSISEGNTNDAFEIGELTGEIRVNKILILPQNTSNEEYDLTILCEDRGVPVFSDRATVVVKVYQDDSLPPSFPNDTVIAFVSEDADLNDAVVTVEAVDLDSEQLRYRLEDLSVPGAFVIGISTGEVIVAAPLDREITNVYTARVVATEERQTPGPERSDNTSLIIYVRDVNDNSPSCDPSFPTATIQETLEVGSTILALNCSDPDTAENGAISYSLSNDFGVLAIDSNGVITLNQSLSETDQNTLVLSILLSDEGSTPNEVTLQATIFISSVNRHVPTFTNLPTTIEVSEAQAIQTVFFSVEATDPDRGSFGEVTYSIVNSTSSDDIGIFSNTGGLYLNRKLNFFVHDEYTLNITAADSDFIVYSELTVEVTDANEFVPECSQSSITTEIQEGLAAGQTFSPSLSCTDDDLGSNGVIVFTIESGNDDGAFEILPDGSLRTLQELDFDNGTQRYELTVNVSDSGSEPESVDVSVAVVVQAVNEFTPEIEGAPYSATVTENSRIGLSVLQLSVTDRDNPQHAHGRLNYEIGGLSTPMFQFTSVGELQVAGEIDREEESSYSFTVTVSDQGSPPLSTTASVTITVVDIDDNSPQFTEDLYVAVLNGTAEEGASVVMVECTDRDEGVNAGVEYSLVAGGDADFFMIDSMGNIVVGEDLPVSDIYSISVMCTGTGPSNFSDATVVSIQVLVDSDITFSPSSSYSLSVPENTSVSTELLTIEASSSTGATLFFDLLSSPAPFVVGETSGILQLTGVLDYETTQTYTLQVRASDNGSPPNFGDAVIQISVTNVNDETPVISSISDDPIAILEEVEVSEPIAGFTCSDSDDGVFGDVAFSILSGNTENLFTITSSGTLHLRESLDYETSQSHSLEIVCEDGGLPPNTDTITIPISVLPVNDHPPAFPSSTFEISVTENLPSMSHVGAPIVATDSDLPPHGDIRYSLTSGNDPRTFALSSETGQLSLVQRLDYETTVSYSLVIVAQDSGGLVQPAWPVLNDTIVVTVTVLDYNDNSPQFGEATYSGTISENAQNGDQVSLDQGIVCSDLDSGDNGEVSLSIIDDSPFTVRPSGLVLVEQMDLLDFETEQLYILSIACQDNGSPSQMTTVNLVVTVQDVNEFGPEFNSSSYRFSVSESTLVGRGIGTVFASDLDAGDAGTISYSIVTSDVPFDINHESGVISLASSLDYETQQASYILQVEASDASSLSDTATVIIDVENEDDNRPSFTEAVYYLEVRENAAEDTDIGGVSCSDADDEADDISISYAIDTTVPFSVSEAGRISVVGALDLEIVLRYTFSVNCSDSAHNTAQATLSINILPYNDFAPVFLGDPPYTTSLAENPSIGTTVYEVLALDDDLVSYNRITYSFSTGNEAGRFSIDPGSGRVRTSEAIDREVQEEYVLTVVAANVIAAGDESGSPSLSTATTLTVTVTDINDNAPVISPSNVSVVLQMSTSANATVVDLDCSDLDAGANGETSFSITSEQFRERFEITESGLLRTTDVIEEDVVVVVTCLDHGTPQRSSSSQIVIETVSMNEHDPVFPGPTTRMLEVREDVEVGNEVQCFMATDADGEDTPDGFLEYSLAATGTDSRFGVHGPTGCVFVALALDYDETNFYEYTLTAEDMGDPPRSASITLEITILDTVRDPPVVQGSYTPSLLEGLGAGTHVATFLCEDSDSEDVLTYSIVGGNSDSVFEIHSESGRIEVAESQILDYEASTSHTLLVQCTDSYNLTDSASVFVSVIPVNEFTPSFEAAQYSVPEHSIAGTVVANLEWEDLDSGRDGEVDFEIVAGDSEMLFEVTSGGQLLVRGTLDRETQDQFELEIEISDLSPISSRFSSNNVTVVLTDINDNRPMFDREVYNFVPLEGDEEIGHFLGVVSCSDSDLGSNSDTDFDISSTSNDASLFSVNSNGHVVLDGDLRNREFDNITFFVQCRDSGPIPMFGTALVIIPVQEENLFHPVFSPKTYSTDVAEDAAIVTHILLTVSATDMDEGVNGRVRYSLQNDFDNTFFIDDISGELSLLRSLDFETNTSYSLVAIATDGTADSAVRMTDSANISISVTGVNEFSPYCPDPIYVAIVNRTTSGIIVDLGCVDDDAGMDGELDYLVVSGNERGFFSLSPEGEVSIPTPIEPSEEVEQYSLHINVSDRGDPGLITQLEVIAIYSFDNLHSPMFNQTLYSLTLSEDTDVGAVVATLTATDNDPSLQGQLSYSLEGVTKFRIDTESGQLFLSAPLDYEEISELTFTAVATDSDPYSPKSGTAEVVVEVGNENDNTPTCSQQLYSASILSTASERETVLSLNCSDEDGNPITYSLSSSLSAFEVDLTTGVVSVAGALTAGTTTVFDVLVTDGLRSTEVSVSVSVRFSNTAPPNFTHDTFNFTVSEDSSLLVNIGTLTASDADSSEFTFYAVDSTLTQFYITPESGDILLTAPLDFESITSYMFEVMVEDGGSHDGSNTLTDVASVTISVENTNDNFPQFSDGGIYGAIVSKSTAVNTAVVEISCTDRDASPYGSPEVTSDLDPDTPFALTAQGSDYVIKLTEPLLDSVSASYFVNLTCTDGGGESAEGQVFIFVPEPDAPTFSEAIYEWLLSENTGTGAEFDEVMATSSDDSDVSYDIADGNPDDIFYIDPSSGVVSLLTTLDYETQQTHGLIVRARDGQDRESRVLLLVKVLDVNDQVPLTPPSARLEVEQNSPIGAPVGTLECSDGDTEEGTAFNFTFIPASDLFSVDQFGVVRLEGELDATPVHVLPVVCSELDMPESMSTGVVTVEVIFVNENTPQFDFSSYIFSISEAVPTLTYVGTVQAEDSDVGSFGEISYSIADGNPDQFFIEAGTGRIGVLTSLDRETTELYSLTVTAVDGGSTAPDSSRKTGTTVVEIRVEDDNDNTPTAAMTSYIESITTEHEVHSSVLSVVCTDRDAGSSGEIRYSLDPQTTPFSIQANGTVLLDEAQTDQTVHTFDVVCTDRGDPPLSSTALVTVIVSAVELEAPVFDSSNYTVTVAENEPIQTTILRVHATPSDSSVAIGYQIVSGNDGNSFQVDPSTGDIVIRNPLDAGEQQYYTLTIRATNTGRNPLSSFTTVDVVVTDINDHSPVFSTPFYAAVVNETSLLLTPVVQTSCTDEDISAEITYSITGGQGSPPIFSITPAGLVVTSGNVDYEVEMVYNLVVVCSDGGSAPRSAESTVRVEVGPVNEFIPSFLQTRYQFSAEENSFGTYIGVLEAYDSDAGIQGDVTYLLQDPGNFSVVFVEPSSGEVLVSNNLDYEVQGFWNLTVIARDGAGAESFVPLLISVSNVNDVLPEVSPATAVSTIPHDAPAGYPVQTYSCTDRDGSPTSLSITSGNELGYFVLNSVGQLEWTGNGAHLLSSVVVSLSLECVDEEAIELQRVVAYTAVTIQVGDLLPPTFSEERYEAPVPENSMIGTSLLNVSADSNGNEVQYSLDELFSSLPFRVDTVSGVVNLTSSLDRENSSQYVFPVQARDVVTGAVGVALVSITVVDVNDNNPVISPDSLALSLPESIAPGLPFAVFQCSDVDEGQNGATAFSLVPPDPFSINEGGQLSISSSLNFETQSEYSISVVCSDQGLPALSTSATVQIAVTGTNEHQPMFSSDSYYFNLTEATVLGTLVGVLSASDEDEGTDLDFQFVGGSGIPYFTINSLGEIRTSFTPTNATVNPTLELVVEVSDGLLSSSAVVTVIVADVNEAPQFPSASVLALWSTSAPVGGTVIELVCFDIDTSPNAQLELQLSSNPYSLPLSFSTLGSDRVTVGRVDVDGTISAGSYIFSLSCSDGALTTTADVTLRVEGVNQPPQFAHGDLSLSIPELTPVLTPLVNISATDPEGTPVVYSITSGTGLGTFTIDQTGLVSLALTLDFETTSDYQFTVTATDTSRFNRESSNVDIFVYIQNVNDVPPVLSPISPQVLTLSEDSPQLTHVMSYECTDPEGSTTTLSLSPTFHPILSPFALSGSSVLLEGEVDYERETEYQLTITCSDTAFTGGDDVFQQEATLFVRITPVNLHAPLFTSPSQFQVSEGATIGAEVGRVEAVDHDNREGQVITYSLLNHLDIFLVGLESGLITLRSEVDFEMVSNYTLSIEASDNDYTENTVVPRTSVTEVLVLVLDTNDNPPTCEQYLINVVVLTGTYDDHFLAQLVCSDSDSQENGLLVYSFVESSLPVFENGVLNLDPDSGELSLSGSLTEVETVVVDVNVADSGQPHMEVRVTLTIQVQSNSLTEPRFNISTFSVTIPEDTPIDTIVFSGSNLVSSLFNPNEDAVSYRLRENPLYGRVFVINSATGDISVTGESQLDYDEGTSEYSLVIDALVGMFAPTAVLNVFLTDTNDNAPEFTRATYVGSVLENQPVGTVVARVSALDIDSGLNGQFVYFISNSINFDVDPESGEVRTLARLDREALPTDSVVVTAADMGSPSLSSTAVVSVTIDDENDVAPRFLQDLYIININNVSPPGTRLLTLTVEDEDTVGEFAFRIIVNASESDVLDLFTVLSPDGTLAQRAVDIPPDHRLLYRFGIEVNDGIRTATTDIIINIVTVTTATLHILENQEHSFDLKGFLRERGFDFASESAVFSFLSGNELNDFAITPNGILSTLGLDREFVAEYHLNINVTDPLSGQVANVLVNIEVEDVNDHSPIFPSDYTFLINETTYVSSTYLGRVEASDMDDPTTRNARLQYSLVVPAMENFAITADGELFVMGTFDREDQSQYVLVVRAEDFGEPDQEYGYANVIVNVLDRNDNNPQFSPPDVVEFFIEVEISDKEEVGPGRVLDKIVAVLPVANLTVKLDKFIFSDPDDSSIVTASLSVLTGENKYKLQSAGSEGVRDLSYVIVTTDYIKLDDQGSVLQISLADDLKEENPIVRNVTILVTEIKEPPTTTTEVTPSTKGVEPPTTGFFQSELGIAVIVVLALIGMAILVLAVCLFVYCSIRYKRSKDPLNARCTVNSLWKI